jgi:aspartate kinase
MLIVKFGGTSEQDGPALQGAAAIVRDRLAERPIVVVSALAGVTTQLLELARHAARGRSMQAMLAVGLLRDRHIAVARALAGGAAMTERVLRDIDSTCDHIASLAEALAVLKHVTAQVCDTVGAYGELMAMRLMVLALVDAGVAAVSVDPRHVVITDAMFGRAAPDTAAIRTAARAMLTPLVAQGVVPVIGGYVGATPEGMTTTLGRGGSDYSAILLGAALDADLIEIWTDVDGMMTADPRLVPTARRIDAVGFDEAAELAAFGAKVLHPSTIAPAAERGIPVGIFNSRSPEGPGTRITERGPAWSATAVAGRCGVVVVKVTAAGMLHATGFLERLFAVFARHGVAVDVVTTSEVSVSATVDAEAFAGAAVALRELASFGDVHVIESCAIVAVVGSMLRRHVGVIGRAVAALDGLAVHMLSLSATGTNVTVVVDEADMVTVIRRLHAAVFDGDATAGPGDDDCGLASAPPW